MFRSLLTVLIAFQTSAQDLAHGANHEAAAIVAFLSGTALVSAPAGRQVPMHAFDWVLDNSTLEFKRDTRAILVLLDGHRYVIEGPARAIALSHSIQKINGAVRELPQLPPLPKMAGIAGQSSDSSESAVTSVRLIIVVRGMFPRDPFRTLPDSTTFGFDPEHKASEYQITLADRSGSVLFQTRSHATMLRVPPGLLKPGERYVWRVKALGGFGNEIAMQAYFTTLDRKNLEQRQRIAQLLSGDADSLTVLAAIDQKLGLLGNTADEIRAAMKLASHPEAYRMQLRNIEKDLYGR
jgi:hypothetical protein